MISKKEVQHVAKLARLGLTFKEIEKFQGELSKILDYIEKLKEVDISKVKITSHPLEIENVVREDKEDKKLKIEKGKLIKLMPEKKNGYLKVKSIF
jgi:aspartyl-tRNA(Asn)/glutamyl-tRNA(Gln) amidotransferase subunit C